MKTALRFWPVPGHIPRDLARTGDGTGRITIHIKRGYKVVRRAAPTKPTETRPPIVIHLPTQWVTRRFKQWLTQGAGLWIKLWKTLALWSGTSLDSASLEALHARQQATRSRGHLTSALWMSRHGVALLEPWADESISRPEGCHGQGNRNLSRNFSDLP